MIDFPPPLNNELAAWLKQQNPALAVPDLYEICRYLHNQFTQFNEKSSLNVVADRLIVNRYLHREYGQEIRRPIKTPVPGLRGKFARFWTKVMPTSYWVALRERFPDLARRNDGYTYGSIADPEAQFTRTVELKSIGFHQQFSPLLMASHGRDDSIPHFFGEFEFMVGYEALTDTLYLHERMWIRTGDDYRYGVTR